jgi:hypothetical protein
VEELAAHGTKISPGARQKLEPGLRSRKQRVCVIWLLLDLTELADVIESAKDNMRREHRPDTIGEKKNADQSAKIFELTK